VAGDLLGYIASIAIVTSGYALFQTANDTAACEQDDREADPARRNGSVS
jgi:hypothetical protein